jgi:hypothetical protein
MASRLRKMISLVMQQTCPLPVYYGFDYIDQLEELRRKKQRFIFMDHAYFDRGYDKANFRILAGVVHQNELLKAPGDRLARYCPFPRPWRQGSKIIVIPVPPMLERWHEAQTWTQETVARLQQHTDREIIVKEKSGPPLQSFLKDCWAVVSHSSVAAVEAAYHGVPVFGPPTSPAFQVGLEDLTRIEAPIFPDREPWLKTLSYSQFSMEEIKSGFAWAVMKELYGAQYTSGTENVDHELEQA